MKKYIAQAAVCLMILMLAGCGSTGSNQENKENQNREETISETVSGSMESAEEEIPSATGEIFAMDTYMTITCYGEKSQEALEAAEAEIRRLDALLSVGEETSEISVLNREGTGELSADTRVLVEEAIRVYETTDGAFDITVAPLMDLWGFTSGEFQVPSTDDIQYLLQIGGSDKLVLAGDQLTLGTGQGIDLGGIAKGYTSSRLMDIFADYEIVSAVVSLGGNVQCYGTKPDGSLWRCGIQDPLAEISGNSYLGVLSLSDAAVITSGAYERNFTDEATGETYHHILDPATGYPANNGLISVTVVSENGMLADALSTACYVMGLEKAVDYWKEYGENFDLILMSEDGKVYATESVADAFRSEYPVETINK